MISTHILDTSEGRPAKSVSVKLERRIDGEWQTLFTELTNDDGRIAFNCPYETGVYRLLFSVDDYFKSLGKESFFLTTPVVFSITDTKRKYHVPLLLNPYGYSTYRGS